MLVGSFNGDSQFCPLLSSSFKGLHGSDVDLKVHCCCNGVLSVSFFSASLLCSLRTGVFVPKSGGVEFL